MDILVISSEVGRTVNSPTLLPFLTAKETNTTATLTHKDNVKVPSVAQGFEEVR